MKIHLANLYGYDKAMFDERVKWAEDHMEQIVESATNPLDVRFLYSSCANRILTCCNFVRARDGGLGQMIPGSV